jgi:hypothetical protein
MDNPILTDKDQYPTEEAIFSHIGKAKTLWVAFFEHIHAHHADLAEEWRYYNDGKSWLMKVTRKSKTIFWLSVLRGAFRVTFYFTDKAAPILAGSSIANELKEQFKTGKAHGKIRGITILPKRKRDIEDAKSLIAIKLAVK